MPARNSKGRFMKRRSRRRSRSRAIVHHRTRTVYRSARRRHHRRRGKHGGGVRPLHLALAAAGVAFLVSPSGPSFVKDNVAKIPGAKTFGPAAALGIGALAVDKFVKPNKWLRYAGYAGLVLAATQVGTQGSSFKWVGDSDLGDYDLGDDDMGDVDDLEDVEG